MDLSKLPRMSGASPGKGEPSPALPGDSAPQPPTPTAPTQHAGDRFCLACGAPLPVGARFCSGCGLGLADARPVLAAEDSASRAVEGFLMVAAGLVLGLLFPRFFAWLSHLAFGTTFAPFMLNGREVPYPSTTVFYSDLGVALGALAMVVHGGFVLLIRRRWAWRALALLTAAMALFNAGYVAATYSTHGLALISALLAIAGALLCASQWRRA